MKKIWKKGVLALTSIIVIIVVALAAVLLWFQMKSLEEGILDVCATQQEAYVQLVVDQINLKENRDEEEIITDILSTLDASSNKYWMFSKDRSILFVKDVMETNRYKGLTTMSYYDSESAREFLESLRMDRVIHRNIELEGKEYVASGVEFSYKGENYRLCLLTNRDVILNNNEFMGAKLQTGILIVFILVLLLVASMGFAHKQEQLLASVGEKDNEIQRLQGMVGRLNEMLTQREHYDTRYQIWSRESFADFLYKLKKRGVKEVVTARIQCADAESRQAFLTKACVLLDKKVLRFEGDGHTILLLYINYDKEQAGECTKPLLSSKAVLEEIKTLSLQELDVERQTIYG